MSTPNSPDARDAAFDEKVRSVLQDRVVEDPAPAPHLFAEAAVGPMARRSLLAAAVVLTAAATWFLSPEGTEATGPEPAEAPAFKAPAERVELESPVEQTVESQGVSAEVDTEGEEAPTVEEVVEVVENYSKWLSSSDLPKLFINADPGSILTGKQREFCRSWPNQEEVTVKGTHFMQEDSPDEIGKAVSRFVSKLRGN